MVLRTLRASLVLSACLGMFLSPLLGQEGAGAPGKRSLAVDVRLGGRGELHGELRDGQGRVRSLETMVLYRGTTPLRRVRTDQRGRFVFEGLTTGVYRLVAGESVLVCRAWAPQLAPPSARTRLLVVARAMTARGQQPLQEVFVANPFIMGTLIAAAIAIPIAVHSSGDDDLPAGS